MQIIKKDGSLVDFDPQKIISAVQKSANRAMYTLTDEDKSKIIDFVNDKLKDKDKVDINEIHIVVENALDEVDDSFQAITRRMVGMLFAPTYNIPSRVKFFKSVRMKDASCLLLAIEFLIGKLNGRFRLDVFEQRIEMLKVVGIVGIVREAHNGIFVRFAECISL